MVAKDSSTAAKVASLHSASPVASLNINEPGLKSPPEYLAKASPAHRRMTAEEAAHVADT